MVAIWTPGTRSERGSSGLHSARGVWPPRRMTMTSKRLCTFAAIAAGAALLASCDQSRQTADGTTKPGDAGTAAATGNSTIAATGSPEQGGGAGVGTPSAASGTINDIDRATPENQAQGQANAA